MHAGTLQNNMVGAYPTRVLKDQLQFGALEFRALRAR